MIRASNPSKRSVTARLSGSGRLHFAVVSGLVGIFPYGRFKLTAAGRGTDFARKISWKGTNLP